MDFDHDAAYRQHHIDPELRKGFKLDNIIVLPQDGEVVRGGYRYHLPPKALEILLFLCQHNNQVVSAEDLLEFGWGDAKTSRSSLTHVISEIRHALDDHKACPEFIQTFPKKGYRLIAKLDQLDDKVLYPNLWPINSATISSQTNLIENKTKWHVSLALLKNSKLFSVSIAFVLSTWALLQAFELLFPIFNIPEWGLKIAVLLLVIGFPLVLLFTWLKEIKLKGYLSGHEKKLKGQSNEQRRRFFYKQLAIDFSFIGILSIGVGFVALYLIESIELDKQATTTDPKGSGIEIAIRDDLVAVLPSKFKAKIGLPDYFKETFQGELTNSLSKQKGFKLVSIRVVNEIPQDSQLSEYVNLLGARYLLDSKIVEQRENFAIMLNIIDGKTQLQVWSSTIKGDMAKLLNVQQEVNRQVVSAFHLLSNAPNEQQNIVLTEDFKAYDSYIQGKQKLVAATTESSFLDAQKLFMNALAFDPNFSLASAGLCQSYLDLFELSHKVSAFQSAKMQCSQLLQSQHLKEDAYLALGKLNRLSGKYQESIAFYRQAIDINAENVDAISGMAMSHAELNQTNQAEKLLFKTINLEPGYWKNYLALGDFYFGQGEYKSATEQYAKITLLQPKNEQAFNRLGAAFYLNDQLNQATAAWERSLDIKSSANIYSNLATSLFFSHKFERAVRSYKKAIEMRPADPTLWANLADAEKYAEQGSDAIEHYQKALSLINEKLLVNPNDTEMLAEKARYQSELKLCDKALSATQKISQSALNDPYIFYALALTSINCEKRTEAKQYLKSAIHTGYSEKLARRDIQFQSIIQSL